MTDVTDDDRTDAIEQDVDVVRLLDFLKDRDAACPVCRYNLRALTKPVCPECRYRIVLTVGVPPLRFGWFLATVAPGIFSGIAGLLLLVPIFVSRGQAPPLIVCVDAFGILSGIVAVVLIKHRYAFLRQDIATQKLRALIAWAVHLIALAIFLGFAFS